MPNRMSYHVTFAHLPIVKQTASRAMPRSRPVGPMLHRSQCCCPQNFSDYFLEKKSGKADRTWPWTGTRRPWPWTSWKSFATAESQSYRRGRSPRRWWSRWSSGRQRIRTFETRRCTCSRQRRGRVARTVEGTKARTGSTWKSWRNFGSEINYIFPDFLDWLNNFFFKTYSLKFCTKVQHQKPNPKWLNCQASSVIGLRGNHKLNPQKVTTKVSLSKN